MNRTHLMPSLALCFAVAVTLTLNACAAQGSQVSSPPSTPAPIAAPNSPNPVPATSAPLAIKTNVRIDPNHPLRIGDAYYPIESKRLGEEGTCQVRIEVDADGRLPAIQLLTSTGFSRLDAACLSAFGEGRLIPKTIDGKPVASWIRMPINWKLKDNPFPMTPQIPEDYHLKVGLNEYPPISKKLHQEGDCVVHVDVAKDGTPTNVRLTKPTGYDPLDQACVSAVSQAPFIPARQGTTAIAASTDINISWRLPTP
jgi:TonB family protein